MQNFFDPITRSLRESLWTFQSDGKDEYVRAFSIIRRDLARREINAGSDTPVPIVAHDYWVFTPIAYFASSCKNLKVVGFIVDEELSQGPIEDLFREKQRELVDRLNAGAYVVQRVGIPDGWGGRLIGDTLRSSFPPERVQQWNVPDRGGGTKLVVYRLKSDPVSLTSAGAAPMVR